MTVRKYVGEIFWELLDWPHAMIALIEFLLLVFIHPLAEFVPEVEHWKRTWTLAFAFVMLATVILSFFAAAYRLHARVKEANEEYRKRLMPKLEISKATESAGEKMRRWRIRVFNRSAEAVRFRASLNPPLFGIAGLPRCLQLTNTLPPHEEDTIPPGDDGCLVDVLEERQGQIALLVVGDEGTKVPEIPPSNPFISTINLGPQIVYVTGTPRAATTPVFLPSDRRYTLKISAYPLSGGGGDTKLFDVVPGRGGSVTLVCMN